MNNNRAVYFFVLAIGPVFSCTNPSVNPGDTVEGDFQTESGLSLQLIASEPLVIDPVAFTFDERFEMYVVEHRGYPDPAEGGAPAKKEGRIAKLSDVDHDGIYDQRMEYAQGFTYPNGILYWQGGVFVSCAPDIFYLKDTTGDGIADIRKVVLTGFLDTKTAQIRMSHPILGLDGWIYVTGGLNGGEVWSPEFPDREKIIYNTGDGRFDPKTFEFQVTGGKSQFGLTFDAFGRRFGCSNRHPVQHIVIEPHHLDRNTFLLRNETVQNVSKIQEEAVVYPISGAATTADFMPKLIGRSHQGTFTSASGLLLYNDHGLGAEHHGNVFICESAQNLVQRQMLIADGVSFKSEIATPGKEFLASKDEWFRPVFLSHGPQPGLYIADMHRKVIDHPSYVPEEIRGDLDFQSGRDMGRIYRMVSSEFVSYRPTGRQRFPSGSDEIATLLTSKWEWQRSMAFQVLLERKDTSISGVLRQQITKGDLDESRVRSLWLLHLLDCLDHQTHLTALRDTSHLVREQAVRIATEMNGEQSHLFFPLPGLSKDPAMRVRFLTSLALGDFEREDALVAIAQIAVKDGIDPWSRVAVLSSIGDRLEAFLEVFKEQNNSDSVAYQLVMQDLAEMLGHGGSMTSCHALFRSLIIANDRSGWKVSTCLGLTKGLHARTDLHPGIEKNTWKLLQVNLNESERILLRDFHDWVSDLALDGDQPIGHRKDAILLLGYMSPGEGFPVLEQIMATQQSPELQIAVVQALTIQGARRGAEWLLDDKNWPAYTPQIRSVVLSSVFFRPEYIRILLDAIRREIVSPTELSSSDREWLMSHENESIRDESTILFKDLESGNRMEVYESYRLQLDGQGSAVAGKQVFARVCSTCHSYAGFGGQVGPDLTGVKNQPADALLLHTLVPNYEVYPTYLAMTIELHSGQTYMGWMQAESANAVTIRTASGTEESILRSNISRIRNTGKSLMPDGLEQIISPGEMNDLIAFLKSINS